MKRKGWKKFLFGGSSSKGQAIISEEEAPSNEIDSVNDTGAEALQIKMEIELADQCFMRNDFDKAVELYTKAIEKLDKSDDIASNQISGDIHVKLSSILQGQGELSYALMYLMKARDIYRKCLSESSTKNRDQVLVLKLVEIVTGIANIHVDKGEIDDASEHYQDAIKVSRDYFESEEKVAAVLMNYGNFLSICKENHIGAVDTLKEALKIQLKSSDGSMNAGSATTLNCMGKVYMRRSRASNSPEMLKDAQRAEACFVRAIQLFRLSMVRNGNEKVIDTLYNLNEARERQRRKRGILRNVRFEPPPGQKNKQIHLTDTSSSDSEESSWNGSVDTDAQMSYPMLDSYSDLTEKKSWYSDLGLGYLLNCGAIETQDSSMSEVQEDNIQKSISSEVQEDNTKTLSINEEVEDNTKTLISSEVQEDNINTLTSNEVEENNAGKITSDEAVSISTPVSLHTEVRSNDNESQNGSTNNSFKD